MMETLQGLLNITDANGEVITFFNGSVTLSQMVAIILAIIVLLIVRKIIKGVLKTIIIVGVVCFALVHFGVASPTQIKDVASQITQKGISAYETVANASDNIKINGNSIKIKLDDKWVDVTDVTSIINSGKDKATVVAGGKSYTVEDNKVLELLGMFK